MRLSADHAFYIGDQHLRGGAPCQDYAASWADGSEAAAVVSDGCSSGGKTEAGAQFYALAASSALKCDPGLERGAVGTTAFCRARTAMLAVGLTDDDMLATLVMARFSRTLGRIDFFGDGVGAFVYGDGSMTLGRLEWRGNRPLYLAYQVDSYKRFIRAHADLGHHFVTDFTCLSVSPSGEVLKNKQSSSATLHTALMGETMLPAKDDLRYVAAFSDGVTQIEGMEWHEAVYRMLAFKSLAGGFVKRRMNRFLKETHGAGCKPLDDISCAVIHIERGDA